MCTQECLVLGHSDNCWMPPSLGSFQSPKSPVSTFAHEKDWSKDKLLNGHTLTRSWKNDGGRDQFGGGERKQFGSSEGHFNSSAHMADIPLASLKSYQPTSATFCPYANRQKSEEKRGGSGSHNWGNVKDEANEQDATATNEETHEGEEHAPADSENKENEAEEVKEEGPKEMTLDEWKAMQNKERTKVEFNIRKPNEGNDGQWKKGYVLHKSKSEDVAV
ncbi:SERPINE1 mRNA-binding protein 1-like, partial [Sardina pilchardus]|uniref:SERPINE1 mRNA-binding protein 1-like n=1 Tax=Sardina pilchardus TaxID=27697 RepID=UPI002E12356D